MQVGQIWRYPVKSMAGERLERAHLGELGIEGDRVLCVRAPDGRVLTARSRPRLLGHRAVLAPDGEPRIDGRVWRDPDVARDVEAAAGPGARLVRPEGEERFDVLPLLVATDGAIAAFGHDGRRLRPNLVIEGVPALAERGWPGAVLRIREVEIAVADLRQRCVMTTFDPDSLAQDREVLRGINRRFGGKLGLDCAVLRGGSIAVGDPVEFAPAERAAS